MVISVKRIKPADRERGGAFWSEMANRNILLLFCGLFLLALIQPSLQGGVYVPPGAGFGPGGAGTGTGLFPGAAGGVPAGYKPAKAAGYGGGGGGRGIGPGGLVPGAGGQVIAGLPTGQGGKAPKPGYGNLGGGGLGPGGYGGGGFGGYYPGAGSKAAKSGETQSRNCLGRKVTSVSYKRVMASVNNFFLDF